MMLGSAWAGGVEAGKGKHGGRLLVKDNVVLELSIFEQGMPPHFRAYIVRDGVPVPPQQCQLNIQLTRFNKAIDVFTFEPIDDFLESEQIVKEPHSFDVQVVLTCQDKKYHWNYESYEGRVKIVPALLKAANINSVQATGATIEKQLKVVGKIVLNRDTMAPVYPRYSGIIKSLTKNLGDEVAKGELLVIIESNESLQNYSIPAPISGTVVQKYATTGELAKGDKPIYDIADLAHVWADLTLYRKDAPLVRQGMKVVVTGDEGKPQSQSTISYISPLGIEDSQTILARAVLSNTERLWLPGMYVNATIIISKKTVPVAVPHSALQRMQGRDVVFVQQGDFFEATPVVRGEEDEFWVEIKSGLESGQYYVRDNSFYLKAEIGKEGAVHDH
ncbi:efflux RND transporter periplasmic adaptor subunit [Legionella worsleiensis]|uniref:HelB protein n=1 Tax=Legionella worsleiensis TaxID=45076 RepID=A0A0W1AL87_9GAMM|nr:efflux RND transporter periplasmic adaptor subunit [Legionella worsleiensis]KTD82100.1 HelB protein [Legionella worsleiensis]STY31467.1 HelB protein [Legionella worsleiensis]